MPPKFQRRKLEGAVDRWLCDYPHSSDCNKIRSINPLVGYESEDKCIKLCNFFNQLPNVMNTMISSYSSPRDVAKLLRTNITLSKFKAILTLLEEERKAKIEKERIVKPITRVLSTPDILRYEPVDLKQYYKEINKIDDPNILDNMLDTLQKDMRMHEYYFDTNIINSFRLVLEKRMSIAKPIKMDLLNPMIYSVYKSYARFNIRELGNLLLMLLRYHPLTKEFASEFLMDNPEYLENLLESIDVYLPQSDEDEIE